jgi:EAL domain-containing protein (putative c-di-GMP-specific phosphodiesterase class I)
LVDRAEAALGVLRQLQSIGIHVALDDFGAGCSSLRYLRSFPFDKIKIDRSFVTALTDDSDGALAIVRAVAQMGVGLGMIMTAEGVENEEQLNSIRAEGCTEVQGFFFSPPRPAQELAAYFTAPARLAVCAA